MPSKLLTGFLAGVAVGILLAPDKGSETRKKIARKSADLKDKFNEYVDTISEKFDSFRDEANDVLHRGKRKAETFTNQSYSSQNDAGNSWSSQP